MIPNFHFIFIYYNYLDIFINLKSLNKIIRMSCREDKISRDTFTKLSQSYSY